MSSCVSREAQAMAVPRDPTNAEIARFIATRSTMQMAKLVQAIQEPASQAAFTASLLLLPPATTGRCTTPEKAKKALNAFVGFRCYYIAIPIFKQYPMKKLSHLLGQLWESDPNKPLWSLMAKAWSTIRDRIGKDNAPLDGFFAIICPYLQMPLPEMYLDLHGWTLSTDKEGGPTLSRDKNSQPASITAGVAHMPISVEDIIAYSQVMGYAQGFVVDANTFSPTFLGASLNLATGKRDLPEVPRAPVDDRMLARNKRRVKKQTARETGLQSLQTLEQDLANTRAFQLQLPEFKDLSDVDLPVSEDHPMYHMLTGFFAGDDQETEMFVDNHEGDLSTGNDQESGLSNDTPFENVETPSLEDWAAFRQGADAEAILPPFGDATNF